MSGVEVLGKQFSKTEPGPMVSCKIDQPVGNCTAKTLSFLSSDGDFAGSTAVRRVGEYLKQRNSIVTAFYVSNVEYYLNGRNPGFEIHDGVTLG
jgi:hypothetical protein